MLIPFTADPATAPLPRGWNRLTWRYPSQPPGSPPLAVVSTDTTTMTMLALALERAPGVVPGSVTVTYWFSPSVTTP